MKQTVLSSLVVGIIAVLATRWLTAAPQACPAVPMPSVAPCPTPSAGATPSASPAAPAPTGLVRHPVFLPPPPAPPGDATIAMVRDENQQLRTRLAELTRQLEAEETATADEHGHPHMAPAGLPARFEGDAMRAAVTEALQQAGFPDAQVTAVDCSEYPCLVFGEGIGSADEMKQVGETDAMAPYAKDGHDNFSWDVKGPDGRVHREFALARVPRDLPVNDPDDLEKRTQFRVKQMRQTP